MGRNTFRQKGRPLNLQLAQLSRDVYTQSSHIVGVTPHTCRVVSHERRGTPVVVNVWALQNVSLSAGEGRANFLVHVSVYTYIMKTHTCFHRHRCPCEATHERERSFPRKNAELKEKFCTRLIRDSVHGCCIPTDLADTTCTSQERATPRCDFSRIAAGKTIFLYFRCPHDYNRSVWNR